MYDGHYDSHDYYSVFLRELSSTFSNLVTLKLFLTEREFTRGYSLQMTSLLKNSQNYFPKLIHFELDFKVISLFDLAREAVESYKEQLFYCKKRENNFYYTCNFRREFLYVNYDEVCSCCVHDNGKKFEEYYKFYIWL